MNLEAGLHTLIGGARSGKSRTAEAWATTWSEQHSAQVVYLATAEIWPDDLEMESRIAQHRTRRPSDWNLVETGDLATAIQNYSTPTTLLLIDCATLWLMRCIAGQDRQWSDAEIKLHADTWIEAACKASGPVLVITNEVGLGIVPLGELSRRFQDQQGWLNQTLGKNSASLTWVLAGIPKLWARFGKAVP